MSNPLPSPTERAEAAEALLRGAGWVQFNAFGTGVMAWFLPNTEAIARVDDSMLHVYPDWFVPAVQLPLTDLDAVRVALAALTPKETR